ncbi:hypothetical protein K432DRAFT_323573 [Lepidopterella palustris CBS 459.81]|uniref:Uncharacterized protein n=1 Tax=Lepidopterella palustris CBS 459.81 TaxID=1314670 RepID=A0A8E2EEZ1_9PEZI|nr:hypothetical protein K432DRAFT_323573 [Lepidopterella palustris CBS 459.81]
MATSAIEARSLSSLTTLASNPPLYPRNPTHEKNEQLVLYIARVPGSRDVFLTPIKPRQKTVTSEDVTSCLYYLHFEKPEDALLIDSDLNQNGDPVLESGMPPPPPVHRKALPPSPIYPSDSISVPNLASANQHKSINPSVIHNRKPAVAQTLSQRPDIQSRRNVNVSNYPQRPTLSPLPPSHQRGYSVDVASLRRGENEPPILPPRTQSAQPPLPTRPFHVTNSHDGSEGMLTPENRFAKQEPTDRFVPTSASLDAPNKWQGPPSPQRGRPQSSGNLEWSSNSPPAGVNLILIRRDPTSGAQWDVALIEDPPVLEVSSSALSNPAAAHKNKKSGAPMYIEITNPGYSKFLNSSQHDIPSLISRGTDLSIRTFGSTNNYSSGVQPGQSSQREEVFKRRLWMEGSKFPDRSFGHRRINSNDSSFGGDDTRSSSESRNRDENHGIPPSFLSQSNQMYSTIQIPDKRSSSFRGYAFLSPWNGRCEFSTGSSGRSLKCKHMLSAGLQGAPAPAPVSVSELRFNLPGSSIVPSTPKGDAASSKRSSFFPRPRHNRHNSLTPDIGLANDMDKLDLSLGQEFAGGGFGGKQAKLGKLIIEDEGLKMMDLLVAANMALWWRVYERVDGKSRSNRASSQS